MATSSFDIIVIGVGGMGSAVCRELARRGRRVLGLEQFPLVHDQGSSHGQTRIIRTAYFEHPDYVPLLRRAWERWYDLEQERGIHLLTECGCLNAGPADGEIVPGVRRSAEIYSLDVDVLDPVSLKKRFPQFHLPDHFWAVFERQAGFLNVEACVRAHIDSAVAHGATVKGEEPVTSWSATPHNVTVITDRGTYHADRLVITAGSWAGSLLADAGKHLRVLRQVPHWFGTSDDSAFRRDRFPVFIAEMEEGHFYGFPVIDSQGLKVARHYGAAEVLHPDEIDRRPHESDALEVRSFLQRHLPQVNGPLNHAEVCLYTPTPDRHFLIDLHPRHPNVCFAAGFSGHGFKFASAIGEVLADLAETGQTDLPIGLFGLSRLTN